MRSGRSEAVNRFKRNGKLSPTQGVVAEMLSQGCSNREIAVRLNHVSTHTVDQRIAELKDWFGADTTRKLVATLARMAPDYQI